VTGDSLCSAASVLVQDAVVTAAAFCADRRELCTATTFKDGSCALRLWCVQQVPGSRTFRCPMRRTCSEMASPLVTMCVSDSRVFGWGGGVLHCWDTRSLQLLWAVDDGLDDADRPLSQLSVARGGRILTARCGSSGSVAVWGGPLVRGDAAAAGGAESTLVPAASKAHLWLATPPCCLGVRSLSDALVGERGAAVQ
jgi:hypothetical protein